MSNENDTAAELAALRDERNPLQARIEELTELARGSAQLTDDDRVEAIRQAHSRELYNMLVASSAGRLRRSRNGHDPKQPPCGDPWARPFPFPHIGLAEPR